MRSGLPTDPPGSAGQFSEGERQSLELPGSAGTIRGVREPRVDQSDEELVREMEASRLLMLRRVKAMTLKERLALFERLSRRVTWARAAKRIR
jgi:hypothetical protein